jgi:hypothetical protein
MGFMRHYATIRKVPGSITDKVTGVFSRPQYGPGVDSASNRNQLQESSLRVKRDRRVRLTTSQPFVSGLYRKCGSLNVSKSFRPSRPVAGIILFLTFYT